MKLTIITSILLLMSLSGCGKETTSYFICTYGTTYPSRFSLVIDPQKKTLQFDTYKERKYEEPSPNYLESKVPDGTKGYNPHLQFDTITGRLSYDPLGSYPQTYKCKKSEKLI